MAKLKTYEIDFTTSHASPREVVPIKAPDAFAAIANLRLRRGFIHEIFRVTLKVGK